MAFLDRFKFSELCLCNKFESRTALNSRRVPWLVAVALLSNRATIAVRLADVRRRKQGPWGAFQFIGRMRAQDLLASLGAMITLLALVFEPVAQQIFSFTPESVPKQSAASIEAA